MKLYLSSYRIPTPDDLAKLLGKPLDKVSVALIPNAKDYYVKRAWDFEVGGLVNYMTKLGFKVSLVDLRGYNDPGVLKEKLARHDLVWAMGGNTYMLRYEMRRSGFEKIIHELLESGMVYGGDSAGALVAGVSIAGVESADEPEFAEEIIKDGLGLVPFVLLPHVDNPEFADVLPIFRKVQSGRDIIELKDSEAAAFDGEEHWTTNATSMNKKESQEQLSARLAEATQKVTVGARYRHYKQQSYKVLNLAIREEDNEPVVVYQAEYGDQLIFTRLVSSWIEEVGTNGGKVRRFTKIEDDQNGDLTEID